MVLETSFTICKDCGFSHPPEPNGQPCRAAKEKTLSGREINFSNFFLNLKNMLTTKIKEKNIEHTDKLFATILLEVFKVVENYKEDK